jgi:hypothetical protein
VGCGEHVDNYAVRFPVLWYFGLMGKTDLAGNVNSRDRLAIFVGQLNVRHLGRKTGGGERGQNQYVQ